MVKKPKIEVEEDENILGLSTTELADLTVGEVTNNETAIKMIMHYYKQLVGNNNSLKNENNTLKTYVDGYSRKKVNSGVGATLLAVSNVLTGFGINLLTSSTNYWPGGVLLGIGILLIILGLFLSYRD